MTKLIQFIFTFSFFVTISTVSYASGSFEGGNLDSSGILRVARSYSKNAFSRETFMEIEKAERLFKSGNSLEARRILDRLRKKIAPYIQTIKVSDEKIKKHMFEKLLQQDRMGVRRTFDQMILSQKQLLWEMKKLERESRKQHLISDWFSPMRVQELEYSSEKIQDDLLEIKNYLDRNLYSAHFKSFPYEWRKMELQLSEYTGAMLTRKVTMGVRAEVFHQSVQEWKKTGKFPVPESLIRWNQADTREEIFRIYVNRETVSAVGLAACLIGEVLLIPFSGGTSSAAIPATVATIARGVQVTGDAIMAATAVHSLTERVNRSGTKEVFTVDGVMSMLSLMRVMPLPVRNILRLKYGRTFLEGARLFNKLYIWRRPFYGLWKIVHAKELSQRWGIPEDMIIRNAWVEILVGVSAGSQGVR